MLSDSACLEICKVSIIIFVDSVLSQNRALVNLLSLFLRYLLEVSILPHEANTVLGLFCHWQLIEFWIHTYKMDLNLELSVYQIWILK